MVLVCTSTSRPIRATLSSASPDGCRTLLAFLTAMAPTPCPPVWTLVRNSLLVGRDAVRQALEKELKALCAAGTKAQWQWTEPPRGRQGEACPAGPGRAASAHRSGRGEGASGGAADKSLPGRIPLRASGNWIARGEWARKFHERFRVDQPRLRVDGIGDPLQARIDDAADDAIGVAVGEHRRQHIALRRVSSARALSRGSRCVCD